MIKKTITALAIGLQITTVAQLTPCANANELMFNGKDNYVNLNSIQSDVQGYEEFTIEFWMKANRSSQLTSRAPMFAVNDPTGIQNKFMIVLGGVTGSNAGKLMITDLNASGTSHDFMSTEVIGDDMCHHIAYTRDGNLGTIYIDGVIAGTHTISYSFGPDDQYSIGQEYDGVTASQFYKGMIDDFRIWKTVRTESEIWDNMNNELTGTESDLVSYYNFNQGIAGAYNPTETMLTDLTSTNDGELIHFELDGDYSNWVEQSCLDCAIDPCASANELAFDGIDDYVNLNSIQSDVQGYEEFTIEFWMNADRAAQTTVRAPLFAVNGSTGTQNKFMIVLGGTNSNTGNLMITDLNAWGSNNDFMSTTVIGDNMCHHIAYTRNGNLGTIYIDGVEVGTHAISYYFSAGDQYSIGQEYDGVSASQFYNGMIDDFRIWKTVRTAAEISGNMNNELTGTESGLVSYYNFNQGVSGGSNLSETTATDITSINDGVLYGFDLTGTTSNWVEQSCLACVTPLKDSKVDRPKNTIQVTPEIINNDQLTVYPNPAHDQITVQFDENLIENTTVQMINLVGEVVSEHTFNGKISIETSHLRPGVYLVTMINNSKIITKRVIIN